MIPKLYASDGATPLAWLSDATVCEVTEERNGIFELYMEIPTASDQYPMIENDCFVKAKPSESANEQLFRVYSVEKSMTGRAIVQAEHQSYQLAALPVDEVTVGGATATAAMQLLLARAATVNSTAHGFTAVSDVPTVANFSISAVSARAALGGVAGSVLQRYGGEYEFDGKVVRLHKQRGADHGVKIEYAKNLRALKASISTEKSYTGLFPYIKTEDTLIFLAEKVLWVDNASGIQLRVMARDFTQDVGENPSEAKLRAAAESYLTANNINAPDISLEVDFVHLWQSPEYAEFIDLERVALCDIVTVRHPDLGVDISAKVIKTVYDTLKERYKKITVGSAKSNMASVIAGIREEIAEIEAPDLSGIQTLIDQAIADATNAITGNSGGKVILNPPLHPQELLVLTDANSSIQTAVRLWRWNAGGLGFSSNGYNGPFSTAITADGKIVADFIMAGTMTANVIKAGVLSDVAGKFSVNMTTGAAALSLVTITGGSIAIPNTTGTNNVYDTFLTSNGIGQRSPSGTLHWALCQALGGDNSPILQLIGSGAAAFRIDDAKSSNPAYIASFADSAISLSRNIRATYGRIELGPSGYPLSVSGSSLLWNGSTVAISSVAEAKDDIELAQAALPIIMSGEVCKYRFVGEGRKQSSGKGRAQYGLVIGGGRKTPGEVITDDGGHVDLYAMISLCWKGVQELSETATALKDQIQTLERKTKT